jgi:hypothetical protein
MFKLYINLHVTEEQALEINSVEYGEIAVVRDRWGKELLQVKDQKYSNLKMPRRRKMPNVNVDNVAEDHNSQHLLHFVPPPSDDGNKPGDEPGDEPVPSAMASESQPLAPTLPPPVLRDPARFVVPPARVTSKRQLSAPALATPIPHDPAPFKLLPAAEISSILKPIKTGTLQHAKDSAPQKQLRFEPPPPNDITSARKPIVYTRSHEEKIKSLKAQLAALQANRERVADDASSSYEYEIVDVSMNNPNGDDNEGLPEIRIRTSKDKRLFEFEKTRAVPLRGDLGRFGTQVPQEPVRKVKAGVPRISPISFYQGVAAPPSARAAKGKHRAAPTPILEESPNVSHQPSSPLHTYGDAFTQQRYLTDRMAGPSRETYL